MHLSTLRKNLFAFTNKRYIRHQTARVIVVNSVLFIFAISSQVTKASSEVCSSTTLPNLMESLERNTPHYKLPPTCWRPTPLRKTPLKRWNTLFGRGIRGTLDTTTPVGSEARVLTAPPTSETARWGNHFCFRYQETKLLNFLDMLGGVGGFLLGENHCSSCWEEKTQIHTGAKSQSWTVLRPKVPDKLHPLPHSFKPKPHLLPLKKARPAI